MKTDRQLGAALVAMPGWQWRDGLLVVDPATGTCWRREGGRWYSDEGFDLADDEIAGFVPIVSDAGSAGVLLQMLIDSHGGDVSRGLHDLLMVTPRPSVGAGAALLLLRPK